MSAGARYDAIIVGGGTNGLATAALLAKAGRRVLVAERRDVLGGLAAGEEFHPGYRTAGLLHDTSGVRPAVIEALDLTRHGLELSDGPAPVFAPQASGRGLLLHHDAARARDEIAAHSPRDAERYAQYREFLARVAPFARRLLDAPLPDPAAADRAALWKIASTGLALRRLGARDMLELLRVGPMCVADGLNEWFESEILKCALAAPALAGNFAGPWSPGTHALLLRGEALAHRSARRGPPALVAALVATAKSAGVDLRTGAHVERIRVAAGKVEGVTLAGGETIDARVVAASCDPRQTLLRLVRGEDAPLALAERVENFRAPGMTAAVHLALSAPLSFACRPDHAVLHARTGETLDDMERAFDAAKYGRFSPSPLLEIYSPSTADPALAPAGHAVVSMLVHFAPHSLRAGWGDATRAELGDAAVAELARYAPSVTGAIVAREVLTPADIEARYGTTTGHVFHGDHALDQLVARPFPECARYATPIEGLFLCGSGSHPGGGITCGPGALAAAAMLAAR
jgi:phytoene dehydrogenase-like protein